MEVAPVIDKCRIVGVLDDGVASLGTTALQHLRAAQLVIGGTRTLQLLAAHISPDAVQHDLSGALSQVPEWIRAAQAEGRRVVVLATGDPLCHGIAAYLASRLCIEAIEVMPNVSTLQLACARLGLPWQDMKFSSVHSKDAGDWVPGSPPNHGLYALLRDIRQHDRLAVLTSPDNTPDRIARMLIAEGLADEVEMAVAERLCQPEERIVSGMSLSAAAQMPFADPNVVLLWRTRLRAPQVLLGLPDASFEQRHPEKGLITKHEVRAVSLATPDVDLAVARPFVPMVEKLAGNLNGSGRLSGGLLAPQVNGTLTLSIGMSSAHYYLAGRCLFADVLKKEQQVAKFTANTTEHSLQITAISLSINIRRYLVLPLQVQIFH